MLPSHHQNFEIVDAQAMTADRPVVISNKVNIWREAKRRVGTDSRFR